MDQEVWAAADALQAEADVLRGQGQRAEPVSVRRVNAYLQQTTGSGRASALLTDELRAWRQARERAQSTTMPEAVSSELTLFGQRVWAEAERLIAQRVASELADAEERISALLETTQENDAEIQRLTGHLIQQTTRADGERQRAERLQQELDASNAERKEFYAELLRLRDQELRREADLDAVIEERDQARRQLIGEARLQGQVEALEAQLREARSLLREGRQGDG